MYLTAGKPKTLPVGRPKALPFWAFIRRRRLLARNRFDAAVAAETGRRVSEMSVAIAAQIPSKLAERADHLRAEVCALREERARLLGGFIPLAVRLRGFKTDHGGCEYYVLVEINRRTGELRPAHSDYRHIISNRKDTTSNGWYSGGGWDQDKLFEGSALGAPDWQKIEGDPDAVVLLGAIYRCNGDHRVTGMQYK